MIVITTIIANDAVLQVLCRRDAIAVLLRLPQLVLLQAHHPSSSLEPANGLRVEHLFWRVHAKITLHVLAKQATVRHLLKEKCQHSVLPGIHRLFNLVLNCLYAVVKVVRNRRDSDLQGAK